MPPSPRRALAWSFAERYLGLLVSIGSTMVLSRLLSPSEVGVYSLCAAFTVVAGILRDFGVSEYLIQEKELTRDKLRAAYGIAFGIAWSIGAGIFFSRNAVSSFYNEPQVADVLLVLTLHFFILPVSSPTFALLNRELAFKKIFYLQLFCNSTQAVTSVSMAFMGWGVMSLAWGPIANVAAQSLILLWMRPKEVLTWPGVREVRSVLRFGSMFVASRTIEVLTRNFHEPVIGKMYDFASVGLFSRAFGLIELFHSNIGAAVIRVATPAFATEHRAGRPLDEVYARSTSIFVCVSWAFFGFIALMAEPIIRVMFGPQWVEAAPIAVMLAISALPQGVCALAPQMLSATGHVGKRLKVTLAVSPLHLIGVLIAAPMGLRAVAAVWLFSSTATLLMYMYQLNKILGLTASRLITALSPSFVVASMSVASQAGVLWCMQFAAFPALVQIPVTLTIGCVVWVICARVVRHPAYDEISVAWSAARSKLSRT